MKYIKTFESYKLNESLSNIEWNIVKDILMEHPTFTFRFDLSRKYLSISENDKDVAQLFFNDNSGAAEKIFPKFAKKYSGNINNMIYNNIFTATNIDHTVKKVGSYTREIASKIEKVTNNKMSGVFSFDIIEIIPMKDAKVIKNKAKEKAKKRINLIKKIKEFEPAINKKGEKINWDYVNTAYSGDNHLENILKKIPEFLDKGKSLINNPCFLVDDNRESCPGDKNWRDAFEYKTSKEYIEDYLDKHDYKYLK